MHQLTSFPQQISNGSLFFGIDIALRKYPKSKDVCQPIGIRVVIAMLHPLVLFDRHCVHQMRIRITLAELQAKYTETLPPI